MTEAIRVDHVVKEFGTFRAIDDVSFKVARGDRLALIGPNGAGKTTLFDLLTSRTRATSGTISVGGRSIARRPDQAVAMGVSRSFQVSSVFGELTVLENLQFAVFAREGLTRRVTGRASRLRRKEARDLAGAVGLSTVLEAPAGTLSHGDQRALELGLALASSPTVLFLDEPTAGMAPAETEDALRLVSEIADERELTLVFTEHDMQVVFGIATSVAVLSEGRLVTVGSPDQVRTDPRVRDLYLGSDV